MNDFESRFERIQRAIGSSNDSVVAKALNIKQQSVAGARKRKHVPHSWIVKIAEKYNVSADWLLFGEGVPYRDEDEKTRVPLRDRQREELVRAIRRLLSAHVTVTSIVEGEGISLSEGDKQKLKSLIEKDSWIDLKDAIWDMLTVAMSLLPTLTER